MKAADGVGAVDEDEGIFAGVFAGGFDGTIELVQLTHSEIGLVLPSGVGDEGMIDDEKVAEQIIS